MTSCIIRQYFLGIRVQLALRDNKQRRGGSRDSFITSKMMNRYNILLHNNPDFKYVTIISLNSFRLIHYLLPHSNIGKALISKNSYLVHNNCKEIFKHAICKIKIYNSPRMKRHVNMCKIGVFGRIFE